MEQVPAALPIGMHRDIARVLADAGAVGVDQALRSRIDIVREVVKQAARQAGCAGQP